MTPKEKAVEFYNEYLSHAYDRGATCTPEFEEAIDMALKAQAEQIFKEVECNIVMPYEGVLKSTSIATPKGMHTKITDDLRNWFNKLRNRWLSL